MALSNTSWRPSFLWPSAPLCSSLFVSSAHWKVRSSLFFSNGQIEIRIMGKRHYPSVFWRQCWLAASVLGPALITIQWLHFNVLVASILDSIISYLQIQFQNQTIQWQRHTESYLDLQPCMMLLLQYKHPSKTPLSMTHHTKIPSIWRSPIINKLQLSALWNCDSFINYNNLSGLYWCENWKIHFGLLLS